MPSAIQLSVAPTDRAALIRLRNFYGELLDKYATSDLLVAITLTVEKPSDIIDFPAAPRTGNLESALETGEVWIHMLERANARAGSSGCRDERLYGTEGSQLICQAVRVR
jgi:hypothetical protein